MNQLVLFPAAGAVLLVLFLGLAFDKPDLLLDHGDYCMLRPGQEGQGTRRYRGQARMSLCDNSILMTSAAKAGLILLALRHS